MKSNIEIAEEALRLIDRVIKNELPTVSCPEKQSHVLWKREEVKQILINKLHEPSGQQVGPQTVKA